MYRVSGFLGKAFSRGLSPVRLWPVPCPSAAVGVCVSMRPNNRPSGKSWFWSTFLTVPQASLAVRVMTVLLDVPACYSKKGCTVGVLILRFGQKSPVRPGEGGNSSKSFGDVATVLHVRQEYLGICMYAICLSRHVEHKKNRVSRDFRQACACFPRIYIILYLLAACVCVCVFPEPPGPVWCCSSLFRGVF